MNKLLESITKTALSLNLTGETLIQWVDTKHNQELTRLKEEEITKRQKEEAKMQHELAMAKQQEEAKCNLRHSKGGQI